jgi:type 1 glutamine amidotransferase
VPGVHADVYTNGWPKDPEAFDDAAAIIVYSDGGDGHPFIKADRLKILGDQMHKGVGLGCIHYAVEVPKNRGGQEFLHWIGGYFETYWSVNPTWEADFKTLPQHPITRGVRPFTINDEWYYHMRFPEDMQGVTPILTAIPPESTHQGRDDAHGGNQFVRARVGMPEHVMWAYQRPDGARGFGFTGGHYHKNWANPNFRKVVLNAILWTAKVRVPQNGVDCEVTADDVQKNLDPKEK